LKIQIRLAVMFALFALALPVQAQEGDVTMAYFVTTDLANVMQLEEGMADHVAWHAEQNDPWPGFIYQALHGGPEYVWVSPGHTWADFDNPPVDGAADMADFAERAGEHTTSLDVRTWVTWSDVSMAPPPDAVIPLWQVIEWDFKSTSEGTEAVRAAFAKVKAAFEQTGESIQYTVNEVVALDAGPQLFVALARPGGMAEMDAGDPNGLQQLLAGTYGHADAVHIMRTFEKYLIPTANRFWVLRPDLSHMPDM
jgi:hypothetical protein